MTSRFKSRLALAFAAVTTAALATACGGDDDNSGGGGGTGTGGAGGVDKVQVMMFPGQSYRLEVLVAQEKGFFKNHNIETSVIAQPNNLQGAQAMVATKSQVGQLSTPTLAQGVEGGSPVAFFCGGIDVLQTTLVAKKGSTLPSTDEGKSWQDVLKGLSGKKVGVQTPVGSGLQLLFAAALAEAGATDITYINLGGGNDVTLAALNNGSVDVAQSNPPGTQRFNQDQSVKPLLYVSDGPEAYKLYGSAWTGQTSWLKDNPRAAKGFCDAVTDALKWIKDPANADEAAQILSKDTGVDSTIAKAVVEEVFEDFSTELPEDVLKKTFAKYAEYKITKTDLTPRYSDLVQKPAA